MNVMPMTNVHMDTTARSAAIHVLLKQVRAEYAEMPGLSVTLMQAERLWAADRATCEGVFRRLIVFGVSRDEQRSICPGVRDKALLAKLSESCSRRRFDGYEN